MKLEGYVCSRCGKPSPKRKPPDLPEGWAHIAISKKDHFEDEFDGFYMCPECAVPIKQLASSMPPEFS